MKYVLLMGLLLLSGCSNFPYPQPPPGTVVWYQALGNDPRSLDPQTAYDIDSYRILGNITEPLYQYSYGTANPFKIEPSLASGLPQRELLPGGGEAYTLTLRRGVRYQNDPCFLRQSGREVTSADLIYSIKRIADPHLVTPNPSPVYAALAEVLTGLREFHDQAAKAGKTDYRLPLQGVRVLDRYRVRVQLRQVYPAFKYWLTLPFFAPVPEECTQYYGKQFQFHPVGTGAYQLERWEPNRRIILRRNPNYQGSAQVDVGYFSIMREATPVWLLFRQGYLDQLGDYGRGLKDTLQRVVSREGQLTPEFAARGIKLTYAPQLDVYYLAFNLQDPVVGPNQALRQALSLALDSQRFIDLFYSGVFLKAESPIPPGVSGYDPSYRHPYGRPDLRQARQRLKAAGYPDGLDPKTGKPLVLEIVYDNTEASLIQARFLIQSFQALGIRTKVRFVDFAQKQDVAQQGRFQIMSDSWVADYPDPQNFFLRLYSQSDRTLNPGRYQNSELDRLYRLIQDMEDGPLRERLVRRMITLVNEDCPWLYLFHQAYYSLSQPWAEGVLEHPLAINTLKYYRVDTALREVKLRTWNQPNYAFMLLLIGSIALVGLGALWGKR